MIDGSNPKRVVISDADGNLSPVATVVSSEKTLNANNTTASVAPFRVTGDVLIKKLYGVVTEALSNAITAAHWRTNDGGAQVAISLATGTTLSSFVAGSLIVRKSVATVALTGNNSSAAAVVDPVAATAPDVFMPFAVVQKNGANTDIEFRYTTTNTPASGKIKFYAEWQPLSDGAKLEAL